MTALMLLLIPAAILAIFLVPKSKSDIPDDVTVGVGDLFPAQVAKGGQVEYHHLESEDFAEVARTFNSDGSLVDYDTLLEY